MNETGHTHIVVNIWEAGDSNPAVFGPFEDYSSAIKFLRERNFQHVQGVLYSKAGYTARILLPPA